MTEKRARTPLSKVRIPYFEREFAPVKPSRSRVRFKTVDDVIFEVCDTSIVPSTYMNRLIYGSRLNSQQSDITHALPNVAADVFEKVMRYCYFHTSKYCDGLLPNEVKEWDDHFMDLDPRQLCELASAAYYLDVKELIELTCRAIAAIISGKTAEQIRKTFHIENDLAGTIDRVLPNTARRRGREHSPKESNRKRDTNDSSSQERNQGDLQQENASAQKSVDELTEWINSSSSKSTRKKKKKRHKDKNPAKKANDYRENSSEVCDAETVRAPSTESQVREAAADEGEPLARPQEAIDITHKSPDDHGGVDDRDKANGTHFDEAGPGYDPDPDGGSSSSDIAFVSEKLVSHVVAERRTSHNTGAPKASATSGKLDHPSSASELVKSSQDEACNSATSDADSVQYVPPSFTPQSHSVKQEKNSSESSSEVGESSESDAAIVSGQNDTYDAEGGEGGDAPVSVADIASNVKTGDRKCELPSARPLKEDSTVVDVPGNPASVSKAPDEETPEEPFIDCPENMDREVEDFQQRLSITEPLSSHRNTSQLRSPHSAFTAREDRDLVPPMNTDGPWNANGKIKESSATPSATGRPGSSNNINTVEAPHEGREHTRRDVAHSAMASPSIPKEALTELLRISSEKKEVRKIAAAIDEETARLGAKREKIRDCLAVLNMQERELRQKYNLSGQFP